VLIPALEFWRKLPPCDQDNNGWSFHEPQRHSLQNVLRGKSQLLNLAVNQALVLRPNFDLERVEVYKKRRKSKAIFPQEIMG
jgi:hypothetical protein